MNLTKHTRAINAQLDETLIAIRIEEFIRMIMPAIVFVYVAGMMVRKITTKISKSFIYESPGTITTIQPSVTGINGVAFKEFYPSSN